MRNWKNANFPFNIMENCSKGLKYALSGHMEIHPCPTGHQPLGAAALLSLHFLSYLSKQCMGYRWSCAILGWLVTFSAFLSVLSSLLLPKYISDLHYCSCPPHATRVAAYPALFLFKSAFLLKFLILIFDAMPKKFSSLAFLITWMSTSF